MSEAKILRADASYDGSWNAVDAQKNARIARAGVREIEGVGLELRYYWDAELMQSWLFKDGTELLKEAQIKRFDLEERGWVLVSSNDQRHRA
jgi:hypothetical protein